MLENELQGIEQDYFLGETFADIGERVVSSTRVLNPTAFENDLGIEMENGEAGRVARLHHAAGEFVHATILNANQVRLFITKNPEIAVGVGIAIAGAAAGVIFKSRLQHVESVTTKELQ